MKFMTIGKAKDTFTTLPPTLLRQLMEATLAYMNQHKKEGKIQEYYYVPGWGHSIIISELKSAEEMMNNLSGVPLSSFMDYEIYPLADFNESIKVIIERLKAAEKMMAGAPK
jgi:muconolactone delta-isomerase